METLNLKFENGLILYQELQWVMYPVNMFLAILNEILEHESKEKCTKLLLDSSAQDAATFYEHINSKSNAKQNITQYLDIINTLGLGETKLTYLSNTKIITNITPHLSKVYQQNYSTKPKIELELVAIGYIKNFLEKLYNKKITYQTINKQITTIAEFTITTEPTTRHQPIKLNINKKERKPSPILQKILINKHIKLDSGKILLWNTYATITSFSYLINLTSNQNQSYKEFFTHLGAMQAKAAVDLQKSLFGVQKDKMFSQIIEQTELIGIGTTTHEKTKEGLKFQLKHNLLHYSKQNKNTQNLETYFVNLIKGTFDFSFNKTTNIEKKQNSYNLIITKNTRKPNSEEIKIDKYINSKNIMVKSSGQ
jgi:hypothetical protein